MSAPLQKCLVLNRLKQIWSQQRQQQSIAHHVANYLLLKPSAIPAPFINTAVSKSSITTGRSRFVTRSNELISANYLNIHDTYQHGWVSCAVCFCPEGCLRASHRNSVVGAVCTICSYQVVCSQGLFSKLSNETISGLLWGLGGGGGQVTNSLLFKRFVDQGDVGFLCDEV